jgi:hypothetical protein
MDGCYYDCMDGCLKDNKYTQQTCNVECLKTCATGLNTKNAEVSVYGNYSSVAEHVRATGPAFTKPLPDRL